jgi:hypothetical protein
MADNKVSSYFTVGDVNLYELDQNHNPIFDPIGEVPILFENGLVKSKNRVELRKTDLNPDGTVNHDKLEKRIMKIVSIDLHAEVANCVRRLAQTGWIQLDYKCITSEDKNPSYQAILEIEDWYCSPQFKEYLELYPPLYEMSEYSFVDALGGKLLDAIIYNHCTYSEEWYCATICGIYFSNSLDTDINNVALLGKLLEQKHWKCSYENDAIANKTRTESATKTNKNNAAERIESIVKLALEFSEQNELFSELSARRQATHLLEKAFTRYPKLFGTKKNPKIKVGTVTKYLEDEKYRINNELHKFSDEK